MINQIYKIIISILDIKFILFIFSLSCFFLLSLGRSLLLFLAIHWLFHLAVQVQASAHTLLINLIKLIALTRESLLNHLIFVFQHFLSIFFKFVLEHLYFRLIFLVLSLYHTSVLLHGWQALEVLIKEFELIN